MGARSAAGEIHDWSATAMAVAIQERRVSALECLDHLLARIARLNPAINAIVTVDADGARRRAREADEALARGAPVGPLHGVPVTLKDCHETAGMRTVVGFPPLADHVPARHGVVAARLEAAGANLIGKTNVPPLLMQPQTDNPVFGRTSNPWDHARTPGGSSGGSAAALAARLVPLEVGSDMGGSIRMPAHFCGVYGFKPTANRIPRTGHVPDPPGAPRTDRHYSTSGPMARDLDDIALGFRLLAGPDGEDTEVAPVPVIDVEPPPISDLRIAWAPTFPGVPVARAIRAAIAALAADLARTGARVEETLPPIDFERQHEIWAQGYRMMMRISPELWGMPVPAKAQAYAIPSATDLMRTQQTRDELIRAWERFFADWDVLVCPAAIVTAFPHCPPSTPVALDEGTAAYGQINHHCFPFNITGHPALVVPLALDPGGLPIGAQLVGRRWGDERLIAIARALAPHTGGFRPPPDA
jgi:amidase